MIKANFHTHSLFCDGKSSMEEMVQSAIKEGFSHLGFSSHGPIPFANGVSLPKEKVPLYVKEFKRLKEIYANQINLYLGMELDFITGISENLKQQAEEYGLDYFIGSVHFVKSEEKDSKKWFIDGGTSSVYDDGLREVFSGDTKKAVKTYYHQQIKMIENNRPDIIGHCDKIDMHNKGRYFSVEDKWYEDEVLQLIDIIKQYGVICEINTRGLYRKKTDNYYPNIKWIKRIIEKNIPVVISTDCHLNMEVGMYYEKAYQMLSQLGCKYLSVYNGQWEQVPMDTLV